jgi:polysaccharide biosynthesis/export protein
LAGSENHPQNLLGFHPPVGSFLKNAKEDTKKEFKRIPAADVQSGIKKGSALVKKRLFVIICALAMIAGWSCSRVPSGMSPNFQNPGYVAEPLNINDEYILQSGDTLEVKFFSYPELNEKVTIRPDGRISLQAIEEVKAAGLKPQDLESLLKQKYAKILKKPEAAVIVKEFSAQKVFVGGEVKNPGVIPLTGKLTSLQAIFQSGGFLDTANMKTVVVLRNQGSGQPAFKTINLKEALFSQDQKNDILLNPYDVVFVPKSNIAQLNQFMNQYFEKLLPISKTFGFTYLFGPGVVF